jgi:hypothetical protein
MVNQFVIVVGTVFTEELQQKVIEYFGTRNIVMGELSSAEPPAGFKLKSELSRADVDYIDEIFNGNILILACDDDTLDNLETPYIWCNGCKNIDFSSNIKH